ncbi:MAG: S41 family peptidase [Aureispira sp.]|nr:S41 family peptidase [Aureispira sp.]
MQKSIKKYLSIVAVVGLAVTAISTELNDDFEIAKNLEIFSNVYKELNTYYVDELNPEKVMRTGMDAMLKSLDPYTTFISPEEVNQFQSSITGKYGGIGTTVLRFKGDIIITEPYKGGPAQKAGVRAGDVVLSIDGESIKGKNTKEVSLKMRGTPNTTVKLGVKRPGVEKPLKFELTREQIKVPNLPYYEVLDDDMGYIVLSTFSENAGKNVSSALMELKAKAKLKGVILDLRGNTGGLLSEAVNVANVFLNKGQMVVQIKGRDKANDRAFRTLNAPVDIEIPLVVLINKNSASASEIVAGCIQDLDRGVVIGQRSYGKGLVQNTRNIAFGAKVKLTTARYYIPSGRCIQATKYKNGSPLQIADSLREAYKTQIGRTVYDGGGISPDIKLSHGDLSKVLSNLNREHLLFDYSVDYMQRHKTIEDIEKFELKDEDFEDFLAFLKKRSFTQISKTEKAIQKLEKTSKEEKYFSIISKDIKALQAAIEVDKKQDMKKHKTALLHILQKLIARNYYYKKGYIQSGIHSDLEIKKALETLNDVKGYESLLTTVK